MNDAEDGENYEDESQNNSSIDAELDPNHTHFILVDDGSHGIYSKENEFRVKLENELRKGKSDIYYQNSRLSRRKQLEYDGSGNDNVSNHDNELDEDEAETEQLKKGLKKNSVPMVLIVVQGGPKTLHTIEIAINQNVPILVLAESKGCADLIANACAVSNPEYFFICFFCA